MTAVVEPKQTQWVLYNVAFYYVALALLRRFIHARCPLGIFFRSCKSERQEKKTERADKKGEMFVDNTG